MNLHILSRRYFLHRREFQGNLANFYTWFKRIPCISHSHRQMLWVISARQCMQFCVKYESQNCTESLTYIVHVNACIDHILSAEVPSFLLPPEYHDFNSHTHILMHTSTSCTSNTTHSIIISRIILHSHTLM